jgi:two-component system response regulator YesN
MMHTVFIVDDELLVIKSLKASVAWQQCGFEVIGHALSGEEALESIRHLRPDVVFSDIRMPGMNGLELFKRLKDAGVDAYFIIVSGLAEFALAQKAIQHGVFGYCLKPFDEMEIMGYLNKMKKKLEIPSSMPEEDVLEWIESGTQEDHAKLLRELERAGITRYGNGKLRLMLSVKRDKLDLSGQWPCISLRIGYRKFIYLMAERDAEALRSSDMFSDPQMTRGIGFSRPFMDTTDIVQAILEAELQAYRFFTMSDDTAKPGFMPNTEWRGGLPVLPVEGNAVENIVRLDSILLQFRTGCYDIRHAMQLHNDCVTQLSRRGRDASDLYLYSFDQTTELFEDVGDMIGYLQQAFREEQAERNVKLQFGRNQTLASILAYINERYSEDVSIQAISKRFNVSANYVSQLFRKELDKTFTEYLNGLRMERAADLLRTSSLPISEIAERVGYKDYFYFSKLFKKMLGAPPKSYRTEQI